MKTSLTFILLAALLASYQPTTPETHTMEDQKDRPDTTSAAIDTTPKVTGIGGIFFLSDDPKQTKDWYAKNLGLQVNDWGAVSFDSRNIDRPEEINTLQWTPFKKSSGYFEPSKKEFMINYQVQNIEAMVSKLRANGVTILDTMATYDYGKFIHIMDEEGNKIELWEPADSKEGE